MPPRDPLKNYADVRKVHRPQDGVTTDKPVADMARYLEHGLDLAQSSRTNGHWRPGQLIGQNGSDPAVMKQSPSYAPVDKHKEAVRDERRSATSTGHLIVHGRPRDVCLGWGGYDDFLDWQSYGRQVTEQMVKEEDWVIDPLETIVYHDEDGEAVDTIESILERSDLPAVAQAPIPLFDKLTARHKESQSKPKPKTPAFPGTFNVD